MSNGMAQIRFNGSETIDFQLYAELKSMSPVKFEPTSLGPLINMLIGQSVETIYVLIVHHYMISDSDKGTDLELKSVKLTNKRSAPYNGKILNSGKGIIYTIDQLPPDLQQIIANYVSLTTTSK